MKRIIKGKPPAELTKWLRRQNGLNCTYSDLPSAVKLALQRKLLKEQGWLCGYTGIRVSEETSHIEHIYPQTRCLAESGIQQLFGAKRDVDYRNVIAAFPKDAKGHALYPFGAISRGHWYDAAQFIHPLRPECAASFVYKLSGEIATADGNPDGPAAKTITHLCLDHDVLNELRRAAIDELLFDEGQPISKAQVQTIQRHIYDKNADGRLYPFCFVLDQACRQLLAQARREKVRREAIQRQQKKQR